ncbi:MAG: carbon-nitrogen hydrolase family protein [Bdellovibrionales bacterium]
MPNTIKVACVQMTSGPDIDENLQIAEGFIRDAAGRGATLIATPEMTDSIRRYAKDKREAASDKPQERFSALAKDLGIWLLAGSFGVRVDGDKLANRSMLFAPDGGLRAHYDKIHMFDVKLSRTEFYNESKEYEAGSRAVVARCDGFNLGMGVCYDLRFPHLWRDLAKNGAQILSAPAAFTLPTGKAHWEVLLRARAIETGCFVIAPAQTGEHEGDRKTYGHSMIISPWGEILAQAGTQSCIITADLDLSEVENARAAIPALTHDRDYIMVSS